MPMIKRRMPIPILCLLACTLALLTLSACNQEERLMGHFPEWVEVSYKLSDLAVNLSIEMEFQGINFEAYSADGEVYDEVLVHLVNNGNQDVYRNETYGILYLYNDKWYTAPGPIYQNNVNI